MIIYCLPYPIRFVVSLLITAFLIWFGCDMVNRIIHGMVNARSVFDWVLVALLPLVAFGCAIAYAGLAFGKFDDKF